MTLFFRNIVFFIFYSFSTLDHKIKSKGKLILPTRTYRVTQNKIHPHLAILYFINEVTQVCIILNEVQFNEVQFRKCLSERNISNCAVIWETAQFEISSRFFSYKCFLVSKKCQSSLYV